MVIYWQRQVNGCCLDLDYHELCFCRQTHQSTPIALIPLLTLLKRIDLPLWVSESRTSVSCKVCFIFYVFFMNEHSMTYGAGHIALFGIIGAVMVLIYYSHEHAHNCTQLHTEAIHRVTQRFLNLTWHTRMSHCTS